MAQPTLPEPRVVVGLDFGTAFTGFAYAHTSAANAERDWLSMMLEHRDELAWSKRPWTLIDPYCELSSDDGLELLGWKTEEAGNDVESIPAIGEMLTNRTKFKLLRPSDFPVLNLFGTRKSYKEIDGDRLRRSGEFYCRSLQPESNSKYAGGRKRKTSCDIIDEEGLMSWLAPSIRKQVEEAIKLDRSVPINDDDLMSRLAPCIRKELEEALSSTLRPLVCALRSREEDEQKHREKMLALETQKLALKRAKLQFERQRVARRPPHPRASSHSKNRVKKNRMKKNPTAY